MRILVVNDDGIHAPGLQAIATVLKSWGDVTVVAPHVEQSGVGHRITYLHPLLAHKEYRQQEFYGWRVEGSPADCVKLGIMELCGARPDLVVSGINAGANVGINVLYSGTVAAAIEGAFFGIPAIALSQWLNEDVAPDYDRTARLALPLCQKLYAEGIPAGTLWNLNFPPARPEWPRGVTLVDMGVRRHSEKVEKRIDPRGRAYYWCGLEAIKSHHVDPGTDIERLLAGEITMTPLHFDLTERSQIERFKKTVWSVPQ